MKQRTEINLFSGPEHNQIQWPRCGLDNLAVSIYTAYYDSWRQFDGLTSATGRGSGVDIQGE